MSAPLAPGSLPMEGGRRVGDRRYWQWSHCDDGGDGHVRSSKCQRAGRERVRQRPGTPDLFPPNHDDRAVRVRGFGRPGEGNGPVMSPPVAVALLNDYELVVRGLAAMLEPYRDRVRVVELDVSNGSPSQTVDVALIDTFGTKDHGLGRARRVLDEQRARHVVIYTWDSDPRMCEDAAAAGLSGMVVKSAPAEELVSAIERVAAGEVVVAHASNSPRRSGGFDPPGPLSERETEVLVLLAQGLTNRQIAEALFLSPETVKTYVSRLYAKLGVTNRASAVVWAMARDLGPPMAADGRSFERQRVAQGAADR